MLAYSISVNTRSKELSSNLLGQPRNLNMTFRSCQLDLATRLTLTVRFRCRIFRVVARARCASARPF